MDEKTKEKEIEQRVVGARVFPSCEILKSIKF